MGDDLDDLYVKIQLVVEISFIRHIYYVEASIG